MPNFKALDARITSALNRIIYNFHFNRRIRLEEQKAQKEDRFLRGRQIAYLTARGMGSPRQVRNRRRRTRKGPELACVQTPVPPLVPSSRRDKKPPVGRKGGRAELPARASGRHVV